MTKIRVSQLAEALGMPNSSVVRHLQGMGIDVKNSSSSLVLAQAERFKRKVLRDGLHDPELDLEVAWTWMLQGNSARILRRLGRTYDVDVTGLIEFLSDRQHQGTPLPLENYPHEFVACVTYELALVSPLITITARNAVGDQDKAGRCVTSARVFGLIGGRHFKELGQILNADGFVGVLPPPPHLSKSAARTLFLDGLLAAIKRRDSQVLQLLLAQDYSSEFINDAPRRVGAELANRHDLWFPAELERILQLAPRTFPIPDLLLMWATILGAQNGAMPLANRLSQAIVATNPSLLMRFVLAEANHDAAQSTRSLQAIVKQQLVSEAAVHAAVRRACVAVNRPSSVDTVWRRVTDWANAFGTLSAGFTKVVFELSQSHQLSVLEVLRILDPELIPSEMDLDLVNRSSDESMSDDDGLLPHKSKIDKSSAQPNTAE